MLSWKRVHGYVVALGLFVMTVACVAQSKPLRVLVIVTSADHFTNGRQTGAWLEEFATPYDALAKAGVQLAVASPKGGAAPIDPHSNGTPEQEALWVGARKALKATVPLASVKASSFDAVFIPGGHGPLFDLATDKAAAQLISTFAQSGKPVASVCHGPAALLGVVNRDGTPFVAGKKLTAFSDAEEKTAGLSAEVPFSVQQRLSALGAIYTHGDEFKPYALTDGTLITGQNPASSERVAELLLQQLKK